MAVESGYYFLPSLINQNSSRKFSAYIGEYSTSILNNQTGLTQIQSFYADGEYLSVNFGNAITYCSYSDNPNDTGFTGLGNYREHIYSISNQSICSSSNDLYWCHYLYDEYIVLSIFPFATYSAESGSSTWLSEFASILQGPIYSSSGGSTFDYTVIIDTDTHVYVYTSAPSIPSATYNSNPSSGYFADSYAYRYEDDFERLIAGHGSSGPLWSDTSGYPGEVVGDFYNSVWGSSSHSGLIVFGAQNDGGDGGHGWMDIRLQCTPTTDVGQIYLLVKSALAIRIFPLNQDNSVTISQAMQEGGISNYYKYNNFPQSFVAWELYGPIYRIYIPTSISLSYTNNTYLPWVYSKNIIYNDKVTYEIYKSNVNLILYSDYSLDNSNFGSLSLNSTTRGSSDTVYQNFNLTVYKHNTASSTEISFSNDVYSSSLNNEDLTINKTYAYNIYVYNTSNIAESEILIGDHLDSNGNLIVYDGNPLYVEAGQTYTYYLREVFVEGSSIYDFPCSSTNNCSVTNSNSYLQSASINAHTNITNKSVPGSGSTIYNSDFYTDSDYFNNGSYTSKLHTLQFTANSNIPLNDSSSMGYIAISTDELSSGGNKIFKIPLEYNISTIYLTGLSTEYIVNTSTTTFQSWEEGNFDDGQQAASENYLNTVDYITNDSYVYLHIKAFKNPYNANNTDDASIQLVNNLSSTTFYSGTTGSGSVRKITLDTSEVIIRIGSTDTFTVRYTYQTSSGISTTDYQFDISIDNYSTSLTITQQPGHDGDPRYDNAGETDWFSVSWSGDETWQQSSSSSAGYITVSSNKSSITNISCSNPGQGQNGKVVINYNADNVTSNVTGCKFTVTFKPYQGNTLSVDTSTFTIIAPLQSITASCSTYSGWGDITSPSIKDKTSNNDIIWCSSSGKTLSFSATTAPSGRSIYFGISGGPFTSITGDSYTSGTKSVSTTSSFYNSDRATTSVRFENATSNPSISTGYDFKVCRYTETYTPVSSTYDCSAAGGSYVDVILQYNGDEYASECTFTSPTITGTNSASIDCEKISTSNPTSSTFGTVTYRISVKNTPVITDSTQLTLSNAKITGKGSQVTLSSNVTINLHVDQSNYAVSLSASPLVVYGKRGTQLTAQTGSYVSTLHYAFPSGSNSWMQYSYTATPNMWLDVDVFNNDTATNVLNIRNNSSSVYTSKRISIQANQYDSGVTSSGDTDYVDITFGIFTFSTVTYNGHSTGAEARSSYYGVNKVYKEDKVQFIVSANPAGAFSASASSYWYSITGLSNVSYSKNADESQCILTGVVTNDADITGLAATFAYYGSDDTTAGTYNVFTIDTIRSRTVDNITGVILTVKGVDGTTKSASTTITVPASISSLDSIDYTASDNANNTLANNQASAKSLTLNLDGNTAVSTVQGLPRDGNNQPATQGYTYTITIYATNDLGDSVVCDSAGTLTWIVGRDGYEFGANPTDASVNGNTNQSATYSITCKYKDDQLEYVYCHDASIISNDGSTWCTASITHTTDNNNDTITVTTTAKNYTNSPKTATITIWTRYGETDVNQFSETKTFTFVQNPLLAKISLSLSKKTDNYSGTVIGENSLSTKFKTLGTETKEYDVSCILEERATTSDSSTETTINWSVGGESNGTNGFSRAAKTSNNVKYLELKSSDNSGDSSIDRGAAFTISTDYANTNAITNAVERADLIATYTKSYNINVSQDGPTYGNYIFTIDGQNDSSITHSMSSRAKTNAPVEIVCKYDKIIDGVSTQRDGNWYWTSDNSIPSWLTGITPAQNTNVSNTNMLLTMPNNTDQDGRTYVVIVHTSYDGFGNSAEKRLTLEQKGTSTEFSPKSHTVDASTTNYSDLQIYSDEVWQITNSGASWVTVSPTENTEGTLDPSGNTVYDTSMNLTIEENFVSNESTYVKYRTDTSNRNTTIVATSASNVVTSFSLTQQAYTWSPYAQYPTRVDVSCGQVSFPIDISTNYQMKILGTERLAISDSGISGPNFDNSDGAGTVRRLFLKDNDSNASGNSIRILCNSSNTQKISTITIRQVKIGSEDTVEDRSFNIIQPAASYNENSLKILYGSDNTVIAPIPSLDYGTLEFNSAGMGVSRTIKVQSELGGWYISSESLANKPEWINNISITESRGFTETNVSPYKITEVTISCNIHTDVNSDREAILTFVHENASNISVNLRIFQKRSDVHFALVRKNEYPEYTDASIFQELKNRKDNNPIVGNEEINILTNSTNKYTDTLYLYYYAGGSTFTSPSALQRQVYQILDQYNNTINISTTNLDTDFPASGNTNALGNAIREVNPNTELGQAMIAGGWDENFNPNGIGLEGIWIINLSVNENQEVFDKRCALTIGTGANSDLNIVINVDQIKKVYDASFEFVAENTSIGNYNDLTKAYEIPVYGGEYSIELKNLLKYDIIKIVDIHLSTPDEGDAFNLDENRPDYDSIQNWATFTYDNDGVYEDCSIAFNSETKGIIVVKSGIKKFKMKVKPYTIKESQEDSNASNTDWNVKLYKIIFTAVSSSKPITKDIDPVDNNEVSAVVPTYSGNMLIAIQTSIDLNRNPSVWKLISDNSGKIYCSNDFGSSSAKILYSNDTGNDLITNGVTIDGGILRATEDDKIIEIFESNNLNVTSDNPAYITYDERLGVR